MIQRKPSKVTNSFVNSSHEEHLNVVNAIRDDAAVTNLTSVVKSVNFESEGDGSYILRKPLVKYLDITDSENSRKYLLFDKSNFLTIENSNTFSFSNNHTLYLRYYDVNLQKHVLYLGEVAELSWISEIHKIYNASEHTVLAVTIDYNAFKETLDTALVPHDTDYIKRFLRITQYEDDDDAYILDIVTPEINTITSATDSTNAETLDINLLLENPYAVRDLYGYGYVSCTKILSYVTAGDDSSYADTTSFNTVKIKDLTESVYDNPTTGYRILVSSNPNVFNRKFLFLKAFLTTAITTSKYYCCWEYSNDGGVTWNTCPEFISKFASQIETKAVSDLSSADFDSTMYEDSLEKATSYLVEKQVVRMNLIGTDYSFEDTIQDRPDVLVVENPDLSYKYRFLIYLDTEKSTPTPTETTYTVTKTSFEHSTEGYLDVSNKIRYKTYKNGASLSPELSDGKLVLYEATSDNLGTGNYINPYKYGVGNSLCITCEDSSYKLKEVTIKLDSKSFKSYDSDNTTEIYEFLGAAMGVISGTSALSYYEIAGDNPYQMNNITLERETLSYYVLCNAKNLWYSADSTNTFSASTYSTDAESLHFVNLTRCLIDITTDSTSQLHAVSGVDDIELCRLKIASITVTYIVQSNPIYTSTYLTSTTGAYSIAYSNTTELTQDLSKEHNRLFDSDSEYYYNETQSQMLIYNNNYLYVSGTNSAIIKLMNSIYLPEKITKIVPWRGYFLIFTSTTIYLSKYDSSSDSYALKILSNTVGVPTEDAGTIVPILNSVYFKSGSKIYKLVPNLYSSSDDILNVHQISLGINNILEDIVSKYIEDNNFSYADADNYILYIPIVSINKTFCITYNFTKQVWNFLEYPIYLEGIEKFSNTEVYLKSDTALYYLNEKLSTLLIKGLDIWCTENDDNPENHDIQELNNALPYADYLYNSPKELVALILENDIHSDSYEETFKNIMCPISYEIDFGQKSSNYTLNKQYLETKLTFATMSAKDTFPVTLDISTDGISRPLHYDSNTDGALWKNSLNDVGILNTGFAIKGQDFHGIFRQLIVKYSGRGKSIRHVISGTSKTLFKFYSMDVRARILPNKI